MWKKVKTFIILEIICVLLPLLLGDITKFLLICPNWLRVIIGTVGICAYYSLNDDVESNYRNTVLLIIYTIGALSVGTFLYVYAFTSVLNLVIYVILATAMAVSYYKDMINKEVFIK